MSQAYFNIPPALRKKTALRAARPSPTVFFRSAGGAQCGFSLLEVLVAVFLIGVIFVMYSAAMKNVSLNRNAKAQEIALRIASTKMEVLRDAGYGSLPASGSFADSQLASIPSGSASLAVLDFNAETKQVTVTVSWTEPSIGGGRNVVLSTLITVTGGL